MRYFRNASAFFEGMYYGLHYTFVNHYCKRNTKHFWYYSGYGLTYYITGWWECYRDGGDTLSGIFANLRIWWHDSVEYYNDCYKGS